MTTRDDSGKDPYRSYAWVKLSRQRVALGRVNQEPCFRCGREIDYSLKGNALMGPTSDHIYPLAEGHPVIVPLEDLGVAHRRCNSSHGGRLGARSPRGKRGEDPLGGEGEEAQSPTNNMYSKRGGGGSRGPRAGARAGNAPRDGVEVPPQPPTAHRAARPESGWGTSSPSGADSLPFPRHFSPKHPLAVDTLALDAIPWLEGSWGLTLRPWQRLVLERALEVDGEGKILWRNVVVSTGRQLGKSWLMAAVALIRAGRPDLFGEPNSVLHIANNLHAARRIMQGWWRKAEDNSVTVRRGIGTERMIWENGGEWALVAGNSVWGSSANCALADECWDLPRDVIDQGVVPTMVARSQPQLWLFSTANPAATDLMPAYRAEGITGSERTMIAEWSAPPGADVLDPRVWRESSAWWDEQRAEFMDAAKKHPGFSAQWLNQWPTDLVGRREWPLGWSDAPEVEGTPPQGAIASLEPSRDRRWWSVVVVHGDERRLRVWTHRAPSLDAARSWLEEARPSLVLIGISFKDLIHGPWEVKGVGQQEIRLGTPLLGKIVKEGGISHDHGEEALAQTMAARLVEGEAGPVLSGKASTGPVELIRALIWGVNYVVNGGPVEEPAIF